MLTAIIYTWIDAINNKKVIGIVFLDLTKLFDLINHPRLFNKIFEFNIRNQALEWLKSYFDDRSQKVSVAGKLS